MTYLEFGCSGSICDVEIEQQGFSSLVLSVEMLYIHHINFTFFQPSQLTGYDVIAVNVSYLFRMLDIEYTIPKIRFRIINYLEKKVISLFFICSTILTSFSFLQF